MFQWGLNEVFHRGDVPAILYEDGMKEWCLISIQFDATLVSDTVPRENFLVDYLQKVKFKVMHVIDGNARHSY